MQRRWLIAHDKDDVAIALAAPIAAGHKFALASLTKGSRVVKLGHAIGIASADIAAGERVHSHNLAFAGQADRSSIGAEFVQPPRHGAMFQGFHRADGRVGTRNAIAILTSVNCSTTVVKRIAAHFTPERLASYPKVDGVVAFSHMSGCGMAKSGQGIDNLRRAVTGRGSVFGSGSIPTIKLASNAQLVQSMPDNIDVDCSPILDGADLAAMGDVIFQSVIDVASGRQSASERQGIGKNEWVPWGLPGAMF